MMYHSTPAVVSFESHLSCSRLSGKAINSALFPSGSHAMRPSVRMRRTTPLREPFKVRTRSPGRKSAASLSASNASRHRITVEHASDVVGRERGGIVAARQGQVREEHVNQSAGDFGEGVAVEEKKRRGAMTAKKEVECFEKGQRLVTRFLPFVPDLLMRFLIMAVLRASSFARSAVEADDKLPTPVLDKRGPGL